MTRILAWVLAGSVARAAAPTFADDWTTLRLRGVVLDLVDGEWRPSSLLLEPTRDAHHF